MISSERIFDGIYSAPAADIRAALGALEPSDDEAIGKLIGALMTLCNRVAEIERAQHVA